MVDYVHKALFDSGSHDKQWIFEGTEHTLTNDDFVVESLNLRESACDTSRFELGTYSSSMLKISVFKTEDRFIDEEFIVWLVVDGDTVNPLKIGYYFVQSDKLSADRRSRELIMYDALYKLQTIDATDFFNQFMGRESTTMKEFRDAFFAFLAMSNPYSYNYVQKEIVLANDNVDIKFNSEIGNIMASEVLKAILHFNGCNGMIDRTGAFKYIYLPKSNGLIINRDVKDQRYYSCKYEEYKVDIDGVIIRQTETKDSAEVVGNNQPILEGNIFFFEKATTDLVRLAINVSDKLNDTINFTPFTCRLRGNPCYECGDVIRIETDRDIITSVIISRTLTGIQALSDTYETYCDEKLNVAYNANMISDTQFGYIGNEPLDTKDGETVLKYARTAWKLRTAEINDDGDRYYTYMTANKNLIVSNSESNKHTSSNDVTDECSVGSKGYPWKSGYFKSLFVNKKNVIPELLIFEVSNSAGTWDAFSNNEYQLLLDINGVVTNETMITLIPYYESQPHESTGYLVNKYNLRAYAHSKNKVGIISNAVPTDTFNVILVFEDIFEAEIEEPTLIASFDSNYNQLSCNWESLDDSASRFVTWISDELVLEKWDEDNQEWVEEEVFPLEGEEPFNDNQFAENPLIVGSDV